MTAKAIASSTPWRELALRISETMGLHFPRAKDLRRVFREAATELGFADDTECARWLLAQPADAATLQILARHLTVGETYFFRDRAALEALETGVLAPLIAARAAGARHLRIWCAACCTGEEAYTVAILLHRLLPDLPSWNIKIVATDINGGFIERARAANYGEWSFRDAPIWLKRNYFHAGENGRYTLIPEIRQMVVFGVMNLVGEPQAVELGLRSMDVVLCRNALMYFGPQHIDKAVGRLVEAVVRGGYLVVGPGETPCVKSADLVPEHYRAAILFRKKQSGRAASAEPLAVGARAFEAAATDDAASRAPDAPAPAPAPLAAVPAVPAVAPVDWSVRARALAGRGSTADALACCDQWLEAEKLNAGAHYVRAAVLLEAADADEARQALQRALYVDPDFILAHVALGQIERNAGAEDAGLRHFMNAKKLLMQKPEAYELPEGEGMNAHELALTLDSLIGLDMSRKAGTG